MMQASYSIYEAKARLSEIIRKVQNQQRVTLTYRGVGVAEVIPIKKTNTMEEKINRMEQSGILLKPKEPISKIKPLAQKKGALSRFLSSRD